MKPGETGIKRIVHAAGYSIQGLKAAWTHEAAFRQETVLCLVLLPLSFVVSHTAEQWLVLISPLFLLLLVELLNSAIETVVDRIGTEKNELSGRAKDISSAAVMLCLILIGLCWATIIWQNYIA